MAAYNFGKAAGNALSAGASGLQTGNPYIAGGAALLGGAASLFGDKFGGGGNGDRQQQINRYNPQQQEAFANALQTAQQGLASNKFDFAPKAAQARNNFAQQTIPGLLENFSKNGAQRSSAFGQALGSAGAQLNSDLAGMEQDYNLMDREHLMKLLGIGLEPQFDTLYEQGQGDEGNGFGDFLKNPQNLMNLYQLYQGKGGAGAAEGNRADAVYNAQQGSQNKLLSGNFGTTSPRKAPNQFGFNAVTGNSSKLNPGPDFSQASANVAPKLSVMRALGGQPNDFVNNFKTSVNSIGNNPFDSNIGKSTDAFQNLRNQYINSFNR